MSVENLAALHITDIEEAINYWRSRAPAVDGVLLAPPVKALAEVYGQLVHTRQSEIPEHHMPSEALAAWLVWYATTPDTPCIAICSTSQGDAMCKGCGRTFSEVQQWTALGPAEKRAVWRRITEEGTSWRFNKYAERA